MTIVDTLNGRGIRVTFASSINKSIEIRYPSNFPCTAFDGNAFCNEIKLSKYQASRVNIPPNSIRPWTRIEASPTYPLKDSRQPSSRARVQASVRLFASRFISRFSHRMRPVSPSTGSSSSFFIRFNQFPIRWINGIILRHLILGNYVSTSFQCKLGCIENIEFGYHWEKSIRNCVYISNNKDNRDICIK